MNSILDFEQDIVNHVCDDDDDIKAIAFVDASMSCYWSPIHIGLAVLKPPALSKLFIQHGKDYDYVKSLRYGHLLIMTDQDHDGSHIKGLLINFIRAFWPSLLKVPSFMAEFITPIVKATHRNKTKTVMTLYTMLEYESWKESLGRNASSWTIKYYKGLGTSTAHEGKEYLSALTKHKKDIVWKDEQDAEAIELAFSKKMIETRKNGLRQFEPGTYLDQRDSLITYSDFINKELVLFSRADLQRSIPSMLDGLKPGQRNILFLENSIHSRNSAPVARLERRWEPLFFPRTQCFKERKECIPWGWGFN